MSDADRPDLDRFGEQPEEVDEGALLFQPSDSIPPGDDDFLPPEEPRGSRAPVLWMVAAVVVLAGTFSLQFMGDAQPAEPVQDTAPTLPELPPDTVNREALVPIPSDEVEGPVGSSVRVAVRVLGRSGAAVADTLVRFTVESGEGSVQSEDVRTTEDGIAVNFVRLAQRPGATGVVASLVGSDLAPARITATALAGAPERVGIVSGNNQEAQIGQLLGERLYVSVVDAAGNPVPRALVSFRVDSGEGITAPAQTRTDSLGQASGLWRLGMIEGEQTLVATVSGIQSGVTFRANATPRATLEIENASPTETSPVTVVRNTYDVGGSHVCSLAGGSLSCRGANDRGQSRPSGDLGFAALAAGSSHNCALSASGVASCWGGNDAGQLGDGSRDDSATPVRVRTEIRFSTVTAGEAHTCGLAGGGVPLCWGENLSGQIGDGTRNDQTVPRAVGSGLGFQEIVAGWSHTCGRTASGNTFCWGLNSQGQLGDGSNLDRLQPTLVRSSVRNLVAGSSHTCGIGDGQVRCWGGNSSGQLGDGTAENRSEPTAVADLPGSPADLAAGAVHTCALLSDGRAFCWGQNRQGQLGDGTTANRSIPVPVAGDLRFSTIHAGGAQTCAITTDGVEYCWGLNQSGQLGDGTRMSRSTPTRVSG